MPDLTVSIPHQLTRAEVKRRLEEGFAQIQQHYGTTLGQISRTWKGDTMDFTLQSMVVTVPGRVCVEDQVVVVSATLPWVLAALAESVKPRIEQEGRKLLEKKRE
jgi:hypothetical protein